MISFISMLSQLSRVKAEGRLALLSASVAGVELLIHDAMNQAEEELERERHLSEHRKSTEDFSVTQTWSCLAAAASVRTTSVLMVVTVG